jgi:hypothetical protein
MVGCGHEAGLRDKALAAVKKALELDSREKARLSLLWSPTPGSEDNDLEVFKDDPEFANLLR